MKAKSSNEAILVGLFAPRLEIGGKFIALTDQSAAFARHSGDASCDVGRRLVLSHLTTLIRKNR